MERYVDSLNEELKEYFNILCDNNYPEFIDKYIELPELKRLAGIGQFCGCDYTKIYNIKYWYSRLDHSIACALMAWRFTHDKTQTLISLFHDLGTPAFSHCIDFLMNDHVNQESSERNVFDVLSSSNKVKEYFAQDNFNINELNNIDKYTIIENKRPKLCVDRLDGVLHTGLIWIGFWNIKDIEHIYKNIDVLINEYGEQEIGFIDKTVCEKFFEGVYKYSIALQQNEDKYTMQFVADYLKDAIASNYIKLNDLYYTSEAEIISKISKMDESRWNKFNSATNVIGTDEIPVHTYYVSVDAKKRYVTPLVNINDNSDNVRINDISNECDKLLESYKNFNDSKYAYIE